MDNYYSFFRISLAATHEAIRRAYVTRLREVRASNGLQADTEQHLVAQLHAAYAILRDPASRRAYDAKLSGSRALSVTGEPFQANASVRIGPWWVQLDSRRQSDAEIFGTVSGFLYLKQALVSTVIGAMVLVVLMLVLRVEIDFGCWKAMIVSSFVSGPVIWEVTHQRRIRVKWLALLAVYLGHFGVYTLDAETCGRGSCITTVVPWWIAAMAVIVNDIIWSAIASRYDY